MIDYKRLTLTISFNDLFTCGVENFLWTIDFSDIIRFEMRSCCLSKCWLKMNPLILLYTKLSGFSNDHIVYLNLLDHVLYCGKIWGFLSTKNRNNRLCFSCDSIEYTSKIRGEKSITICYE